MVANQDSLNRSALRVLLLLSFAVTVSLCSAKTGWAKLNMEDVELPPGFTVTTYITGNDFDPDKEQNARGIPAIVTLVFDNQGTLYCARTANRLREIYGSNAAQIYRIPPGGAKVTPRTEAQFLFGPPLPDPDELAVSKGGDVFVSSCDPIKGYGSVFRLSASGKAGLFAGGPPTPGNPPLLKDPEGITFDQSGNVYVIDYELGVVVKLDMSGRVINPRFITGMGRGRTLTFDPRGYLWIGSDGPHESLHIDGSGRIYKATLPEGTVSLVHTGPLPSGMSLSPGGNLFVAQRRSGKIFALTPEGKYVRFASFFASPALRTLVFPPVTEETKRLGIAGDLFVMVFPWLDYPVREVIRISGPFDAYLKEARGGSKTFSYFVNKGFDPT